MTNKRQQAKSQDQSPRQPRRPRSTAAGLEAENARLRSQIKRLKENRQNDQQALAKLEAERDNYRRAAYAWASAQVTEEDIKRYGRIDAGGQELAEFIGELEENGSATKDG